MEPGVTSTTEINNITYDDILTINEKDIVKKLSGVGVSFTVTCIDVYESRTVYQHPSCQRQRN